MTIASDLGFVVGKEYKVVSLNVKMNMLGVKVGHYVTFCNDDGSYCVEFYHKNECNTFFAYITGENARVIPEEKSMTKEIKKRIHPDDEITITTTYGALAAVYAIMGKAYGLGDQCLWDLAKSILDPHQEIYDGFDFPDSPSGNLEYHSYMDEWLEALFQQQSEKEKQLEDLYKQIKELNMKVEQIENMKED